MGEELEAGFFVCLVFFFYDFCSPPPFFFKGKGLGVQRVFPTGVPIVKNIPQGYFRALDKMMNGPGME